ncbi:PREDICTED: uncharacterized protein LOC106812501 [Priapulus caudatus]|uniref:Uncharacterized protein LOC106812501 n=1 Tax=Priapulus caudatus TaxID=37621 RepID=A0ABM1EI54_PRICU|nr:PREDICTED: uncharacterized protein LOC106812501 [Priapulus caudatus]
MAIQAAGSDSGSNGPPYRASRTHLPAADGYSGSDSGSNGPPYRASRTHLPAADGYSGSDSGSNGPPYRASRTHLPAADGYSDGDSGSDDDRWPADALEAALQRLLDGGAPLDPDWDDMPGLAPLDAEWDNLPGLVPIGGDGDGPPGLAPIDAEWADMPGLAPLDAEWDNLPGLVPIHDWDVHYDAPPGRPPTPEREANRQDEDPLGEGGDLPLAPQPPDDTPQDQLPVQPPPHLGWNWGWQNVGRGRRLGMVAALLPPGRDRQLFLEAQAPRGFGRAIVFVHLARPWQPKAPLQRPSAPLQRPSAPLRRPSTSSSSS